MAFVNIKCPSCGCAIQMVDTSGNRFCMYCGSKFQGIDGINSIQMEDSGSEAFKKREIDNLLLQAEQKIEEYERSGQGIDWNDIMSNCFEKVLESERDYLMPIDVKEKIVENYKMYTNEKLKKQELENKLAIEKYKEQLELEKQQIANKRKEEEKAEKKLFTFSLFLWIGVPILVIVAAILIFVTVGSH